MIVSVVFALNDLLIAFHGSDVFDVFETPVKPDTLYPLHFTLTQTPVHPEGNLSPGPSQSQQWSCTHVLPSQGYQVSPA